MGPYTGESSAVQRDIPRSQKLYQDARNYLTEHPDRAERLLRESLDADLYNGLAHNDLGVLLLQQGKLYEAAREFAWARTLMPGHPDPRVNLAIALHRGGQVEDAFQAAQSALEVRPGHLPAIQALALLSCRYDLQPAEDGDQQVLVWLAALEQRGDSQWRDWARGMRLQRASGDGHRELVP